MCNVCNTLCSGGRHATGHGVLDKRSEGPS